MQVTLKLYATLASYLPANTRDGNQVVLDVPDGATINDVVAPYGLPPKLVHLVLVNGHFVPPETRAERALQAGDVLAVWPPVAGG